MKFTTSALDKKLSPKKVLLLKTYYDWKEIKNSNDTGIFIFFAASMIAPILLYILITNRPNPYDKLFLIILGASFICASYIQLVALAYSTFRFNKAKDFAKENNLKYLGISNNHPIPNKDCILVNKSVARIKYVRTNNIISGKLDSRNITFFSNRFNVGVKNSYHLNVYTLQVKLTGTFIHQIYVHDYKSRVAGDYVYVSRPYQIQDTVDTVLVQDYEVYSNERSAQDTKRIIDSKFAAILQEAEIRCNIEIIEDTLLIHMSAYPYKSSEQMNKIFNLIGGLSEYLEDNFKELSEENKSINNRDSLLLDWSW